MKLSAPIFRLKRQAKLLARERGAPLHAVLDEVARKEGYRSWGLLAAAFASEPADQLLTRLNPGDLVILGARPGHGKTLLGLQLVVEAARAKRPAFFFSLEETDTMISDRLGGFGIDPRKARASITVDTSDHICADHVIERVRKRSADSLVVIDYLQLLDQRRDNPPLAVQIEALSAFARTTRATIVTLSQIDRSFESSTNRLPGLADVRLPNKVDLGLFTRSCFLHDSQLRFEALT